MTRFHRAAPLRENTPARPRAAIGPRALLPRPAHDNPAPAGLRLARFVVLLACAGAIVWMIARRIPA
jgi:hypothetical protein